MLKKSVDAKAFYYLILESLAVYPELKRVVPANQQEQKEKIG
jgi:hypothetical protein